MHDETPGPPHEVVTHCYFPLLAQCVYVSATGIALDKLGTIRRTEAVKKD